MIEVIITAAIAFFVLSRLYVALGRDDGPPNGRTRERVQADPSRGARPEPEQTARPAHVRPAFTGPAAAGLEAIYAADNSFDPDSFERGARAAYEIIISAFARGDRKALKPLLDDDVYEPWIEAIEAREQSKTDPYELLRIRKLDIDDAELDGTTARVMIRYEAELGDGVNTRTARDIWTFKRNVESSDPNWLLDDVETAS
ncbi:MAG: Tim44/TimA family putative adaptor protein [Hyphomonadaceae bacterium]